MPGRAKPCCHAEYVVVERSIRGGDKLRFNTLPQILLPINRDQNDRN